MPLSGFLWHGFQMFCNAHLLAIWPLVSLTPYSIAITRQYQVYRPLSAMWLESLRLSVSFFLDN